MRGAVLPWVVAAGVGLAAAGCAERAQGSGPPRASSAPLDAGPPPAPVTVADAAALPEPAASSAPIDAGALPPAALPRRLDDMLLVPAGAFTMGADTGGEPDEHPAHTVTLADFYLDATEVTNEAYGQCALAGVCRAPSPKNADANHVGPDSRFRGPKQPVSSISWDDAKAYCAWMKKRLPTEAEFEKAARGTDGRRFPWGEQPPTPAHAVFASPTTQDVATHPEGDGPYGHHDLGGNVWEWVEDIYDPYAYRRPSAERGVGGSCEDALAALTEIRNRKLKGFTGANPIPTECERVLRGGAFNYAADGLRASNRVHHPGRFRLVMSGFRCARDPPP